jgi:hypothetical protein
MPSVSAQTCAAIRYHLYAAKQNPRWGWAMVHTSIGREIFGQAAAERVKRTIQEGIDNGEFTIADAEVGKSLLLGAGLGGILDILYGRDQQGYAESFAYGVLLSLGVSKARAKANIQYQLPELEVITDVEDSSPVNFWSTTPGVDTP